VYYTPVTPHWDEDGAWQSERVNGSKEIYYYVWTFGPNNSHQPPYEATAVERLNSLKWQ
jgi:hypothetical protein